MKTRGKTILVCLSAAVLLLFMLPITAVFADGKTITVDDDGTAAYTTIQEAIDHIAAADDPTGWTIEVKNGTYSRFTVPHWKQSGIADLAIIGESETDVVICVLNEAYTQNALTDNGGINIYGQDVILKNLTIQAGTNKQAWDDAAISTNHGMIGGENVSLTVDHCTLIGPGIGNGATYGIFWACSELHVTGCDIRGFANAIEFMNDGFRVPAGETYYITDNTITDCSFAIHGYMGGGQGGGTLNITNNRISGTDTLRAKVICQDNVADSFVVNIRDNTLTNALVGLVNLQDEGDVLCSVLNNNLFGVNSFYVEAIEPGTIEYYTTYMAPEGADGRWELNSNEGWQSTNPTVDISVVETIVNEANATNAKRISITGTQDGTLIRTFTWLKDILYWVSDVEPPQTTTAQTTTTTTAAPVTTHTATTESTVGTTATATSTVTSKTTYTAVTEQTPVTTTAKGPATPSENIENPPTGDSDQTIIWGIVILLAAAMLALFFLREKRT